MKWGVLAAAVLCLGAWLYSLARDDISRRSARVETRPLEQRRGGAAEEEANAEMPATAGLAWSGKVVDRQRAPLAGALVVLRSPDGATTEATAETRGRVRLRGGERPEQGETHFDVTVSHAGLGLRRAVAVTPETPDEIDLGVLQLGEVASLRVVVLSNGKPVANARVVAGPRYAPGPVTRTGSDGSATLTLLPPGIVDVRAAADGFGRGAAKATVPRDAEVIVVLPTERVLTLIVQEKGTGQRIAGATFAVHEQIPWRGSRSLQLFSPTLDIPVTDAAGTARVHGLARGMVLLLAVRAPGYPPPKLEFGTIGRTVVPGDVTEHVVELDAPRSVRWTIVEAEDAIPPPAEGVLIVLRPAAGSSLSEVPSSGGMKGGDVLVAGWGPGPVLAIGVAPDGSLARLSGDAGKREGNPTYFRAPRHIDVIAAEPDGQPVANAAFEVRTEANHPMAPVAHTDAQGRVRFESLYGFRAIVYHLPRPRVSRATRHVGIVDLEKGNGTVAVTLQPERELTIRVLIEGKPRLPSKYDLTIDRQPAPLVEEQYDSGTLAIRVRPAAADGKIRIALSAPGYLGVEAIATGNTLTLALRPEGVLVLRVAPPADGKMSVQLEMRHAFGWLPTRTRDVRRLGDGTRYGALAAGRYRARDAATGEVSEVVEIVPGAGDGAIRLDLSRARFLEGRVEAPAGIDLREVKLQVEGQPKSLSGTRPPRVRRDGSFKLRVSGDREITLHARHPLLRSAHVKVTAQHSDVVLRLTASPTATFEIDRDIKPSDVRINITRVLLYAGEPGGEPVAELRAKREGRRYTFGGFESGRYTIWVNTAPFRPLVLRDVELTDHANDLGNVRVHDGAGIKVKLLVKEGQSTPRLLLVAQRVSEPRYSRQLNSNGETEVELRGLGVGRFSIRAAPMIGGLSGPDGINEIVRLDGKSTHAYTLDLRK